MRLEKEKIIAACQPSLLSCVHITPETDTVPGPTDSKFGGDYYLPAGAEPPNMELLAQINLAQVPHRKGFPETGLLQFFICTDDAVVEDRVYDGFVWQNDAGIFQVMYYPEVQENQPPQKEMIPQERWFKKKVTSGMRFEPAEEIATIALDEEGRFLIDLGFESLADTLMPVFRAAWAGDKEEDEDAAGEGVYNLSDYGDIDQFCRDFGTASPSAGRSPGRTAPPPPPGGPPGTGGRSPGGWNSPGRRAECAAFPAHGRKCWWGAYSPGRTGPQGWRTARRRGSTPPLRCPGPRT